MSMDIFEQFGRKVDVEIARLHRYVEKELAPEAERHAAEILRRVSGKLADLATEMEAHLGRAASRDSAPSKPPASSSGPTRT
jgi:hypothetical protein